MANFEILYDEPHEATWFRSLHADLTNVLATSITEASQRPELQAVLAYDRPDIILLDNGIPVLVVEETLEVPSGHNVGQRFARIAAAAEAGVPSVYFVPYMARKHGGVTAGPRYMNLRLFDAIDNVISATGSAVTTINWPVDANCEVLKGPPKDADMKQYIALFLHLHYTSPSTVNAQLINSHLQARLINDRNIFIAQNIKKAAQYDSPPDSVSIVSPNQLVQQFPQLNGVGLNCGNDIVLYNVGMTNIRSDPYTGMAILYRYLYIQNGRKLVLWFPSITSQTWNATSRARKDIRLFIIACDAIIFSDRLTLKQHL